MFVRTDANRAIGAGHAIRSLALSQEACSRGWDVTFFMKSGGELIRDHQSPSGLTVRGLDDEDEFRASVAERGPDWAVLDHYDLTADVERELRNDTNVLTIDDYAHRDEYAPSLLLNQNISARETWYVSRGLEEDRLLLGPEYVLLREQFRRVDRNDPSGAGGIDDMVVTLGGGNQDEALEKVLSPLHQLADRIETIHVLGNESLRTSYSDQFTFHSHVTEMATFLSGMDLAVSGGGSTLWELLYLGVPTIAVILAGNQRDLVEQLQRRNVLFECFTKENITADRLRNAVSETLDNPRDREERVSRGKDLVDGDGAARVVERMSDRVSG